MNPWSEAFARHLKAIDVDQKEAAKALKVAESAISYWLRGSVPREKKREDVERWSKGKVKASLAAKKAA
jgi:predicted transcriptional regulator